MYQVFREGIVGIDLFQKFACVFDFPHSSIFLADHLSEVIDETMCQVVPFELGKAGVIVEIGTELGTKKFLLDSAATKSLIQLSETEKTYAPNKCVAMKLTMNGADFGFWKFNVFDIPKEFNDMDGILGIDFFKKSVIGLDFTTKKGYIQFPKLGSKEQFTYWLKSYFGK